MGGGDEQLVRMGIWLLGMQVTEKDGDFLKSKTNRWSRGYSLGSCLGGHSEWLGRVRERERERTLLYPQDALLSRYIYSRDILPRGALTFLVMRSSLSTKCVVLPEK